MLHRYGIWGCTLESELPFPELEAATESKRIITFRRAAPDWKPSGRHFNEWRSASGVVLATFVRDSNCYSVQLVSGIAFRLDIAARSIHYATNPSVAPGNLRHQFLNSALPLLLSLEGAIILHGSAVVTPAGGAIAFIGRSGSGKSTLAAVLANRYSCSLLADDAVMLEFDDHHVLALPSYNGVRLTDGSRRLAAARSSSALDGSTRLSKQLSTVPYEKVPHSLLSFYYLDNAMGSEPRVLEMTASEALMTLIKHTHVLDPQDKALVSRQFTALVELNRVSRLFRFCYPIEPDIVERSASMVLEHVRSLTDGA